MSECLQVLREARVNSNNESVGYNDKRNYRDSDADESIVNLDLQENSAQSIFYKLLQL